MIHISMCFFYYWLSCSSSKQWYKLQILQVNCMKRMILNDICSWIPFCPSLSVVTPSFCFLHFCFLQRLTLAFFHILFSKENFRISWWHCAALQDDLWWLSGWFSGCWNLAVCGLCSTSVCYLFIFNDSCQISYLVIYKAREIGLWKCLRNDLLRVLGCETTTHSVS